MKKSTFIRKKRDVFCPYCNCICRQCQEKMKNCNYFPGKKPRNFKGKTGKFEKWIQIVTNCNNSESSWLDTRNPRRVNASRPDEMAASPAV